MSMKKRASSSSFNILPLTYTFVRVEKGTQNECVGHKERNIGNNAK